MSKTFKATLATVGLISLLSAFGYLIRCHPRLAQFVPTPIGIPMPFPVPNSQACFK